MILPGLVKLRGLLERREPLPPLPSLLSQMPSTQAPPQDTLPGLFEAEAATALALQLAQARTAEAERRVQRLESLPTGLDLGLLALSHTDRASARTLARAELEACRAYSATLNAHRVRIESALAAAHRLREAAALRHAQEQQPSSLGLSQPGAPLGDRVASALGEALEQCLDLVLEQEQNAPCELSAAKDTLDLAFDLLPQVALHDLEAGWAALLEALSCISAAERAINASPSSK